MQPTAMNPLSMIKMLSKLDGSISEIKETFVSSLARLGNAESTLAEHSQVNAELQKRIADLEDKWQKDSDRATLLAWLGIKEICNDLYT